MPTRITQQMELQPLVEVSTVAMTTAATALSQLIGRKVRIQAPRLLVLESADTEEIFNGEMMFGLSLQIFGNARGSILILLPCDHARDLLQMLLGRKPAPELTELELSALKEIGNILASAYLNALGARFKMALLPSVPTIASASAQELLGKVLQMGSEPPVPVVIATLFSVADIGGSGCLVLVPDTAALDSLLSPTGAP